MSRKIKVVVLSLSAAVAILWGAMLSGQASDDPCGGHYAGEGLKALFLPFYDAATCNAGACGILNDSEGVYYRYQVPGGDCIYSYRAGHVIVAVGNSGRNVRFNFEKIADGQCSFPHTTGVSSYFMLRTGVGFTPSRGHGGDPDALVLTSSNLNLNVSGMKPGQTGYLQISIKFSALGDSALYEHHFQAKITYGSVDGILRWVITPIDEPYWVYTVTKVGKKLVRVEPPTWHESSVKAVFSSATCPDDYGKFCFPFKLILERI